MEWLALILLVDDEPTIRDVTACFLQAVGFETVTAQSGREALCWLHRTETLPDAMVLDLIMQEMTGAEFLYLVRADPKWADLPAILMTGAVYHPDLFPPPEHYQAALQKPFQLAQLVTAIRGVLDHPLPV